MKMVHGDLKGANILINDEKRACLADFGITGLIYNLSMRITMSTAYNGKGTTRWMAPELLDPDQFGANGESQPTMGSDIYAFGMVMLEVSGMS